MDGFTSIPIQNSPTTSALKDTPVAAQAFSTNPYKDNAPGQSDGIEIIDETKKAGKEVSFGFLLPLSILALILVFAYFGYLVFNRYMTIEKIAILSDEFQVLSSSVNKSEIDDFIALDNSLRAIGDKLNNHTQLSPILSLASIT
jgi:hypothetical protein